MKPIIITTWKFGAAAAEAGYAKLISGVKALDAIEAAANVTEDDPLVNSVGYGGLPNAMGIVELDAVIMDGLSHNAGAVAGLTMTSRAISVARRVMERTPHTLLVGQNAVRFAREQGFEEFEQLTDFARTRWEEWKNSADGADVSHFDLGPKEELPGAVSRRKPYTPDDHDTIGLCALDMQGNLAGGCTTSGMSWKLPGRVGDSPIIGSGLYVDNEVGAAAATGHGDEMMRVCPSYRVVQLMEQGMHPQRACEETIRYMLKKMPPETHNFYGGGLIALRKDGEYGAAGTASGFRSPDRLWQWCVAFSPKVEEREGPYIDSETTISTLEMNSPE